MVRKYARKSRQFIRQYWRKSLWHKAAIVLATLLVVWIGALYGIAQWYIRSNNDTPLKLGASFIPAYAESLGLDAKQTMDALLNDIDVRHLRLVSYWSQLEPTPGHYDFSLLDWQFKKAEAAGARITLSLGLRQPRWPECHIPEWAKGKPAYNPDANVDQLQPSLENFMTAVVNRYKHSPALDSYQVENEFFLKGFGECEHIPGIFARERLVREHALVQRLDPKRKIIINRSNNALGWPIGKPTPDAFGISIYKRVWDATLTKRYLEYPFPAWFYGAVAGWQKIVTGKDMIIHELQAESWGPRGEQLSRLTLEEANKSFNAARFADRIAFGKGTGMREIYLWGAEYWYYRLIILNDSSLWSVAGAAFKDANQREVQPL